MVVVVAMGIVEMSLLTRCPCLRRSLCALCLLVYRTAPRYRFRSALLVEKVPKPPRCIVTRDRSRRRQTQIFVFRKSERNPHTASSHFTQMKAIVGLTVDSGHSLHVSFEPRRVPLCAPCLRWPRRAALDFNLGPSGIVLPYVSGSPMHIGRHWIQLLKRRVHLPHLPRCARKLTGVGLGAMMHQYGQNGYSLLSSFSLRGLTLLLTDVVVSA